MGRGQHGAFHATLRDFLVEIGVEPTRENMEEVKRMFKSYLKIGSVAALDSKTYSKAISAVLCLMAREFGVELPKEQADKTMTELLHEINRDYDTDNRGTRSTT